MLTEIQIESWPEIDIENNFYVLLSTDVSTINRVAETCSNAAWALEITAQRLNALDHCVIATRRNESADGWLALCKDDEV
jgi:hypothetical protein